MKPAMLEIFGTVGALDTHKFGGKTDFYTLLELLKDAGWHEQTVRDILPQYAQVFGAHLEALINDFTVFAYPYAQEIVAAMRARDDLALGIVTGNVDTTAPIKLRAAGFDPAWFPIGAYGGEAIDRNDLPALAIARAMAHYQQSFTPEQVLIIGDTPADIACARAVGAQVAAVATGFASKDELAAHQPDYLLDDLTAFWDVIPL